LIRRFSYPREAPNVRPPPPALPRPACMLCLTTVVLAAGDLRTLKKMVLERKLAPFYRGEDEEAPDREECPICMLVTRSPT
jgi:hypothetical protein